MIAISFYKENEDTYIRELLLPGSSKPIREPVSLPELYPGKQYIWETALEGRPDLPELGQSLFSAALGEAGLEVYHQRRTEGVQLRFREQPDLPEVAALPWEILHDGRQFVALNARTPIIREIQGLTLFNQVKFRKPLRMLLAWAAPRDQNPLEVEREQIALSLTLARFIQSRQIVVHEIIHANHDKLEEALSLHRYDLFYFTGHGVHIPEKGGFICLENKKGQMDLLPASELARMLAPNFPPLIFLNCCQSAAVEAQTTAGRWFTDVGRYLLTEGASDVIGTLTPIFDRHGRIFGETFLRLFLSKLDTTMAVIQGRGALFGKDWKKELGLSPEQSLLLRQSFFQFLHLSRSLPEAKKILEKDPAPRGTAERHYYVSLNRPVLTGREVMRNFLMDHVEAFWRQGRKAVGVYGLGGLGKTFFSVQAAGRLVRHPDPNLAVDATIWLDLRDKANAGALLEEVAQILIAAGAPKFAQTLREETSPNPIMVARILTEAFAEYRMLLVLDNCETLMQVENSEQIRLRDLLLGLAGHTSNWLVLLTSRERLELSNNGREPLVVPWLAITELTFSERAALFLTAQETAPIKVPPEKLEIVLREVAGHPYELNLFLRDLTSSADIPALIAKVHQQTGEYSGLSYYVGRLTDYLLRVLQILALFQVPPDRKTFLHIWSYLAKEIVWIDSRDPKPAIKELIHRGFVGEMEILTVPSVLISYLLDSTGPQYLPKETQKQLNFQLARIYLTLAELCKEEKDKLFQKKIKNQKKALENIHLNRLAFLFLGLRQALRQSNRLLQVGLLTTLAKEAGGSLAYAMLAAYARQVAMGLEDDPETPRENISGIYHNLGLVYYHQRQWFEAIENLKQALRWEKKTQQLQDLSTTYNLIGLVYQEQRQWSRALENYRNALKWEGKTQQWKDSGTTHHQIGRVYEEQELWQNALESYQNALKCYEQNKQWDYFGRTHQQIARVYTQQQLWQNALEEFQLALKWEEENQQWHDLAGTYHHIGGLYQEQRLWQKALENFQEALKWEKKTQQWEKTGFTYHHIGMINHEQRIWQKALENYQQALIMKEKTQQWYMLGTTYYQIGKVYEERRLWPEALKSYQQALKWDTKTQQWHELGSTYHQIGMVYEEQFLFGKAVEAYLTSLEWLIKHRPQYIDICLNSLQRLANKLTKPGALDQMPPELMAKLTAIMKLKDKIK